MESYTFTDFIKGIVPKLAVSSNPENVDEETSTMSLIEMELYLYYCDEVFD